MTTIPRDALEYLTKEINATSEDAQSRVLKVLGQIDWDNADVATIRQLVSESVQIACGASTEVSAQAAADFYDAARTLALGEAMGATAKTNYDPNATDGAIRAIAQQLVNGNRDGFQSGVLERVDYEVKRAAGDCMVLNGAADRIHPMYARVPTGAETCTFCLMLASRGFVYHTEDAAGAVDHYHAHCDCRVIPGWDGMDVDGYDPADYYVQWDDAITEQAKRAAEKSGADWHDEKRAILSRLSNSKRAKKNGRRAATK